MALMNIFKSFKIIKTDEYNSIKKSVSDLESIKNYLRPEDTNPFFNRDQKYDFGMFDNSVDAYDLYQLSIFSDIVQNVFNTLKNEMFRNGFDIHPLKNVDNDYQYDNIQKWTKCANDNKQTLKEVFMEIENDLNVIDDAYLMARKNYLINEKNEIIGSDVLEFIRVDPLSVEIVFDKTLRLARDKAGRKIFFDPEERTKITHDEFNSDGRKNMRACYKVRGEKSQFQYYDTSEILHMSKYRPSKTYGFSPLYSLYNKIITLISMDYYIKQYYSGDKVPKGMLTINTSNATGFLAWWEKFLAKVKLNPHQINPLIYQSAGNTEPVKWIDFMRNLVEMQYTDVRNEIRVQIGANYNVSPIFQNDVSTGGGLNNEGLQIKVTDRGVEMGQGIYNDKALPWMCDQLGISDYSWTLYPSRDQDKVYEKDIRLKEIEIAQKTAELGIKVSMNETGEFSFSPGEVELQNSSNMEGVFNLSKEIDKEEEVKKPFADYKDFDDCVSQNQDKDNPEAFCGWLKNRVEKSDQVVPKKQEQEVADALLTELEKLISKFDTKTRPSKAELDKKIRETVKDFDKAVKTKSSKKLKAIYRKAMKDLGKDIGKEFTFTDQDKNVVEALKKSPIYQKAFKGISEQLSTKLKDAVISAYSAPGGFSVDKLVDDMKEFTSATESKLKTIARTETTKISVASRKVQYDKTGETYKFYHIGPDDDRTTKMSKEVKNLTKNGVSWDDYVKIVEKVSKKYNPKWVVNKEAPITHPNTRHVPVGRRA